MDARTAADVVGGVVELGGIAVLVGGVAAALVHSFRVLIGSRQSDAAYRTLRRGVGKSILLGLEFLVGADIIKSIAITLTLESVGMLGLIVLVRTFLSWSLEVEVTGAWPWHRSRSGSGAGVSPEANDGAE